MSAKELKDKIDLLQIQLEYLENDFCLTKEEYERTTAKYIGILDELKKKNTDLQNLKENLESIVEERTKELAESEKKYRTIFEHFIDLYYQTDMNGIIVNLSPSVKPLTGYDPEELIGRSVETVYHNPADREDFVKELKKTGFVKSYELKLVKKNGQVANVIINSQIVFSKDNTPLYIEGVIHDISEQKRLEEERLQYERLQGVLEMAGATCHELNQPLQIITGYCEIILMDLDKGDSNRNRMKIMQEQSNRLGDITKKLRNITKYETMDYIIGKIIDIDKASEK